MTAPEQGGEKRASPPFVRSLAPVDYAAEPLALAPDVEQALSQTIKEMRAARDRAAVTAQSYVVTSRTPPEGHSSAGARD